jgi:predicted  nucleic acid-binding Zn-ribbon protein
MSDINTGRTGTPLDDALREIAELRGLLAETVPDPEYRRMQDIEIERLREERKRLREALEKAQGGVTDYAKQYVALRAEIDRLREALEDIRRWAVVITNDHWVKTVLGKIDAALAKEAGQ